MNKIFFLIKVSIFCLFLITNATAKEEKYLKKGIDLFNKKEFDKSKILFERDIVFDPKSEKSYLYLAKIFNKKDNDEEQEINLNNVLLLNPQNDEAIYMLALLKIKQSNFSEAKSLMDQLMLVCKSFCSKEDVIQEKLKKLTPKDEQN